MMAGGLTPPRVCEDSCLMVWAMHGEGWKDDYDTVLNCSCCFFGCVGVDWRVLLYLN